MELLSEVFKSVKKKTPTNKQKTKKQQPKNQKNSKPASWSLTLTWLVGFKPTRDRVLLFTHQIYHS
jgi:hypothetical protein